LSTRISEQRRQFGVGNASARLVTRDVIGMVSVKALSLLSEILFVSNDTQLCLSVWLLKVVFCELS
jgi:hypothetical protein